MGSSRAIPAKIGKFKIHPSRYDVERFRQHVKLTGQPHTWTDHTATTPPKSYEFEWLCDFEIPAKLRGKVGKAPCPICCPRAPKYFAGSLCWYPTEGVIRAVGQECGHTHFDDGLSQKAKNRGVAHWAKEDTIDYLVENLPHVPRFRVQAEHLRMTARELDSVLRKMRKNSSKTALVRLAKLGDQGQLDVFQEVKASKVDRSGEIVEVTEHQLVKQYTVAGLEFLKQKYSIEALANNLLDALSRVPTFQQDEDILDYIIYELEEDRLKFEAQQMLKNAFKSREE
ncbi:MAG: hypothetical protein AAGJ35_13990, partial [Myxococcota bacterium]